jgi:hypothetical protein
MEPMNKNNMFHITFFSNTNITSCNKLAEIYDLLADIINTPINLLGRNNHSGDQGKDGRILKLTSNDCVVRDMPLCGGFW